MPTCGSLATPTPCSPPKCRVHGLITFYGSGPALRQTSSSPHDIGPVRRKLGEVAQLNVAGRRVDQNVGREGTTVDDLVARPRRKRVERWVVNAVWDEEGRRQVAELFDPVRLERLDQAVGGHLDDIARHTHRGHRVIIKRVMVDA